MDLVSRMFEVCAVVSALRRSGQNMGRLSGQSVDMATWTGLKPIKGTIFESFFFSLWSVFCFCVLFLLFLNVVEPMP